MTGPGARASGRSGVVSGRDDSAIGRRVIESPVGPLTLEASDDGLVSLLFGRLTGSGPGASGRAGARVLDRTERELTEYFAGRRTTFGVPLALRGTGFQMRVWNELLTIPFGETRSYGEIARRLGDASKARAVGAANGRNPVAIIVPCHRVIGADGSLTGFGGGLDAKRLLLDLETGRLGLDFDVVELAPDVGIRAR